MSRTPGTVEVDKEICIDGGNFGVIKQEPSNQEDSDGNLFSNHFYSLFLGNKS